MQEEYKNKIAELRAERRQYQDTVLVITKDVENTLNLFAFDDGVTMIDWELLRGFVIGETYPVNSKVKFVKYFEDEDEMFFKTYMEAGGTFGLQEHDISEIVKILKGHLIEQERGDKIYEKDEVVVYAPFEKHKPKSFVDSIYDVKFKKVL